MLSFLKLEVVLFVFLFFMQPHIFGQTDIQPGYVVTHENDTLHGQIRDRKTGPFGEIYEKIWYRGEGKKKRFSPKDIQSYTIGDMRFKSLFLDGEMTFLRVVSLGPVNYYELEFQEQGEQLVQEIEYLQKGANETLVRATQGLFGLKRKRLANFFSDCPELVEKILNKTYKYVFEVVDHYNEWKTNP